MTPSFPFMTTYDPPGTSEGTLDPLGLYQIADQLDVQLVPAVRERMQRIRFLTAMAIGALVTEGLEDDPKHRDASPYLVWEWLVVQLIHHDLAWNPSTIEQRTGRIDRLGCKAEGRQPIVVYLPYLDGTADERQYQVMSHREQWFRVVMGQEEVARLITADSTQAIRLPAAISNELSFKLDLVRT
jgi:hypothetical protein